MLDRDVATLHGQITRDRDPLGERHAVVRRSAEEDLRPTRVADEARPADVHVAVVRASGPVDLEHRLVLEDPGDRRCPAPHHDRAQIVLGIAARVRVRAVRRNPDVTVLRLGTVEGDATHEEAAGVVERDKRVTRIGVGAEQRGRHALGRGVRGVARNRGVRPGQPTVGRVGEALPAGRQISHAVVVPAGDDQVGVGRVNRHRRLVPLPPIASVGRVGVATCRRRGSGIARGVAAVGDRPIGAAIVARVGEVVGDRHVVRGDRR